MGEGNLMQQELFAPEDAAGDVGDGNATGDPPAQDAYASLAAQHGHCISSRSCYSRDSCL